MLKSELIEIIASKHLHLPEHKINQAVNDMLDALSEALNQLERIEIRHFGSLSTRHFPPRTAYNPKTRSQVTTDDKYHVQFKPSKELTKLINTSAKQDIAIDKD